MTGMNRAIRIVKSIRPKRREDLSGKLKLKYVGTGGFRTTYRIVGTRLIIKFPRDDDYRWDNITHARQEIKVIRRIQSLKKMKHLRRYVPKVYYMDARRGVIVTELLRVQRKRSDMCEKVRDVFKADADADIREYNVGKDRNGRFKILDFGCIW